MSEENINGGLRQKDANIFMANRGVTNKQKSNGIIPWITALENNYSSTNGYTITVNTDLTLDITYSVGNTDGSQLYDSDTIRICIEKGITATVSNLLRDYGDKTILNTFMNHDVEDNERFIKKFLKFELGIDATYILKVELVRNPIRIKLLDDLQ